MSRSYKKSPVSKHIGNYGRYMKRQANKRIRRYTLDLPVTGGYFKRLTCSWDICDHIDRSTLNEFLGYKDPMWELKLSILYPKSDSILLNWNDRYTEQEWKKWYYRK